MNKSKTSVEVLKQTDQLNSSSSSSSFSSNSNLSLFKGQTKAEIILPIVKEKSLSLNVKTEQDVENDSAEYEEEQTNAAHSNELHKASFRFDNERSNMNITNFNKPFYQQLFNPTIFNQLNQTFNGFNSSYFLHNSQNPTFYDSLYTSRFNEPVTPITPQFQTFLSNQQKSKDSKTKSFKIENLLANGNSAYENEEKSLVKSIPEHGLDRALMQQQYFQSLQSLQSASSSNIMAQINFQANNHQKYSSQ